MLGNKDEAHRRTVNPETDAVPSFGHRFNASLSRKYTNNKTVLDVGCWTGQMAQLLSFQAKKYIGIDPGEEAISFAKKHIKSADFVVGTAETMSFKNRSFDTVLLFDVIEHVPPGTEMKVYKKINRILKNHGVLIITTPSANLFSILLDPAYFLFAHRHYHTSQLVESLRQAGFKTEFIIKTGTLASLLLHNGELLLKHFLKKKIVLPPLINNMLVASYEKSGFAEIHIIATKVHVV